MSEWTIGAVLDTVADAVPDRVMTGCDARRSTFAESADRTRRLAAYLAGRGFGVHAERAGLANWECGQDRVALFMHNDPYPDMVIACLKARVVPVNVNALARFTVPKVFRAVDRVTRLGNGKADYRWARCHAESSSAAGTAQQ